MTDEQFINRTKYTIIFILLALLVVQTIYHSIEITETKEARFIDVDIYGYYKASFLQSK